MTSNNAATIVVPPLSATPMPAEGLAVPAVVPADAKATSAERKIIILNRPLSRSAALNHSCQSVYIANSTTHAGIVLADGLAQQSLPIPEHPAGAVVLGGAALSMLSPENNNRARRLVSDLKNPIQAGEEGAAIASTFMGHGSGIQLEPTLVGAGLGLGVAAVSVVALTRHRRARDRLDKMISMNKRLAERLQAAKALPDDFFVIDETPPVDSKLRDDFIEQALNKLKFIDELISLPDEVKQQQALAAQSFGSMKFGAGLEGLFDGLYFDTTLLTDFNELSGLPSAIGDLTHTTVLPHVGWVTKVVEAVLALTIGVYLARHEVVHQEWRQQRLKSSLLELELELLDFPTRDYQQRLLSTRIKLIKTLQQALDSSKQALEKEEKAEAVQTGDLREQPQLVDDDKDNESRSKIAVADLDSKQEIDVTTTPPSPAQIKPPQRSLQERRAFISQAEETFNALGARSLVTVTSLAPEAEPIDDSDEKKRLLAPALSADLTSSSSASPSLTPATSPSSLPLQTASLPRTAAEIAEEKRQLDEKISAYDCYSNITKRDTCRNAASAIKVGMQASNAVVSFAAAPGTLSALMTTIVSGKMSLAAFGSISLKLVIGGGVVGGPIGAVVTAGIALVFGCVCGYFIYKASQKQSQERAKKLADQVALELKPPVQRLEAQRLEVQQRAANAASERKALEEQKASALPAPPNPERPGSPAASSSLNTGSSASQSGLVSDSSTPQEQKAKATAAHAASSSAASSASQGSLAPPSPSNGALLRSRTLSAPATASLLSHAPTTVPASSQRRASFATSRLAFIPPPPPPPPSPIGSGRTLIFTEGMSNSNG